MSINFIQFAGEFFFLFGGVSFNNVGLFAVGIEFAPLINCASCRRTCFDNTETTTQKTVLYNVKQTDASEIEKLKRTQDKRPKQQIHDQRTVTQAGTLKMTSGWFPPKEDSPSVVSNRVFMIRRLNKMESQRLGVRLDGLDAEVQQARSLISQEQQELREQLTQIREVKENPSVSVERRKLLQQFSCKEARRPDHGLSGENQRTQQRYRSWSNDDRFRGAPLTQLPLVNGRSRSKGSCTPPRKEQLSISDFRKLRSGDSNDRINNSPSEVWPDISTFVTTKTKPRQRSVSTGAHPRISVWEGIDKNDGVAGLTRDDIFTSTRFETEKSRSNQDLLNLERHSPNWAWKGTRRYTTKKHSATELSEVETGYWHGRENVAISQSNKLASTRKELRQRSFSTNSAPTISDGRVLEVCTEGANKTSTVSTDQSVGSSSSRQRRDSTNCRSRVREGVVVDVLDHKNTNRNMYCQNAPVQFTWRDLERSSSTNCPPLVLEGGNVGESDEDKERKQRSWSSESEDGSIEDGDATDDFDSHGKSCQHFSTFGTGDKTGQNQGNEISLPRL